MIDRVQVVAGEGRWAYWHNREKGEVVADHVCQAMKAHFAGMLEKVVTEPGVYELKTGAFIEERPMSVFDVEDE